MKKVIEIKNYIKKRPKVKRAITVSRAYKGLPKLDTSMTDKLLSDLTDL